MQRLVTPLRRLVLRFIRVYWVQQLAIDRALLAAMRTLRRETAAQERKDAETARMREELTELAGDVRKLQERVGTVAAHSHIPDSDRDPHGEDGQASEP
jgi:hypothetical protein